MTTPPTHTGGSNGSVVRISLDTIYNKLEAVEDCVNKIHSTMQAQDHENRLRSVEKRSWQMPTLTGLVAIAALVVSIVSVVNGGG